MIVTLKPEYKGKVPAEEFKQFMQQFAKEGKLKKKMIK